MNLIEMAAIFLDRKTFKKYNFYSSWNNFIF